MESLNTQDYLFLNDLSIISEINNLKSEVDAYRPLDREKEARIMQKFRLDWNYNSNAIEGNSLDYGETVGFLMHGITAKGKPLKDYLDIRGHNQAIDFLLDVIRSKDELRESDIRSLHKMLLVEPYQTPAQTIEGVSVQKTIRLGEYKRTSNHVITQTGETHYYANPEDTPMLMTELVDWYRTAIVESVLHPVVIAAIFHHRFASIHPFDDGNGRMSRLLMNLILMQYAYPPVVIKNTDKKEYYLALSQADTGDIQPFVEFLGGNMVSSLSIYIRGAKGENIEEPSDLRKKIILFKKEVESRKDKIEVKRSKEVQSKVFKDSILPFLNNLKVALSEFKDLFLGYVETTIDYTDTGWDYKENSIVDSIEYLFNNCNDDDYYVYGLSFLNFTLAQNSFSVEIKLYFKLKDFSYAIGYTVSELEELKRVNGSKYSQWMRGHEIEKYYHQSIITAESEDFVNKIGESFLEYVRLAYDDKNLLSISYNHTTLIEMWEKFLNDYKVLSEEKMSSIRNSAKLSLDKKLGNVKILLPSDEYRKIAASDQIGLNAAFFRFLNSNSKSLKKCFVSMESF